MNDYFNKFKTVIETFFETEADECSCEVNPGAQIPVTYSFREVSILETIQYSDKDGEEEKEISRHFNVNVPDVEPDPVNSFDEALKIAISAQMAIEIAETIDNLGTEDSEEYVGEALAYKRINIRHYAYECSDMNVKEALANYLSDNALYTEEIPGTIEIGSKWSRDIDGEVVTVLAIDNPGDDIIQDCSISYVNEDGSTDNDSADEFLEIYSLVGEESDGDSEDE